MKHVVSSALLLGLSSLSLAAQAAPIALDLPAQPLAASLEQLQGASGLRIRFDRAAVADRRAPALRGTLEPSEALQRLLAGSGLSGEVRGGDAWVEAAATGAGIAPGDSVDLGALSVVATQDPATAAITEDSGSYTTRAMRTSTKLAMSIRETPQSVSVVTRQRMDDQGMRDLNDAVKGVTGLTVQQYGPARVKYAARGFDVDNIMYDGLPTSISTYTQDVISAADLAMFDRVEVVRGATGLMQGAGNPAAAINMVRKRPTQDFRASLQGSVGTWDRYRSEADVSGPLNSEGTLRGRAVVAYQKGNSFQDHVSSERGVFYGIAEADLSPDTTFAIGASNQNDNRNDNWVGLPSPLGGRHLDLKRSSYYGADWSYWDTNTTHLFSDLTHRFANGWQMKLAADKLWARINMLGLYNDCYYSTTGCASMTQNPGDYSYTDDHDSYDAYANGPSSCSAASTSWWSAPAIARNASTATAAGAACSTRTAPSPGRWTRPSGPELDSQAEAEHQPVGHEARPGTERRLPHHPVEPRRPAESDPRRAPGLVQGRRRYRQLQGHPQRHPLCRGDLRPEPDLLGLRQLYRHLQAAEQLRRRRRPARPDHRQELRDRPEGRTLRRRAQFADRAVPDRPGKPRHRGRRRPLAMPLQPHLALLLALRARSAARASTWS